MKNLIIPIFIFTFIFCNDPQNTSQQLFVFEKDDLYGYRNARNEVIIEPKYRIAYEFNEFGIAAVLSDSGWIYINKLDSFVIQPYVFDNGPDYFVDGLARFTHNDKFGFFDKNGVIIIPAQFSFATPFSDSMAAICVDCSIKTDGEHSWFEGGKWGYINKKGELTIKPMFDKANPFDDGQAVVLKDKVLLIINKQGETSKSIVSN